MERIEIDNEKVLNPGDRVELHFKSSSMAWVKAAQIALIDNRLSGRKDWRILSFETPLDEPTLIITTIEVLSQVPDKEANPELQTAAIGTVVTCAAIAGVVIAAGVVYHLTLQKTFLLVRTSVKELAGSTTGKLALGGAAAWVAAAGIGALLLLLPKK